MSADLGTSLTNKVTVHNSELCKEIFSVSDQDHIRNKLSKLESEVAKYSRAKKQSKVKNVPVEQVREPILPTDQVNVKDLPEVRSVQTLCQTVLQNEQDLLQEIDDFLQTQNDRHRYKRETLYQKWSRNVFGPIQSKLRNFMDGPSYPDLQQRKRDLFNSYLSYRNEQIDVFLDTLTSTDYKPQDIRDQCSSQNKLGNTPLDDPLITQITDWKKEQKTVQDCEEGYSPLHCQSTKETVAQMGRLDTNCSTWLAMQLTDIESNTRQRSRLRQRGIQTQSSIHPEEWSKQAVTQATISEELQMPHKREVPHNPSTLSLTWSSNETDQS